MQPFKSEAEFKECIDQKHAIDVWQARLLQLDKRNNLLHFNEKSKNAVRIKCDDVEALAELLTDTGDSGLRFDHLVKENKQTLEFELIPGVLKVLNCEAAELQKRLAMLRRRDREWEEEQGTNVLFVTFGLLDWTDGNGAHGSSPLILQPADLLQNSPREPFYLAREQDDAVVNTTLVYFLEKLGCKLPIFSPEATISNYFEACEKIVANFKFKLRSDVYLSCFAYSKLGMWNDLQQIKTSGAQHPLLKSMLENRPSNQTSASGSAAISETELFGGRLDDILNQKEKLFILPADSSQSLAAHHAQTGEHLIIHGPPGTGKSQTIANLIGMLLSEGKSVLFVSEKTAALDVVKRRLDKAGLGTFCLDLHSERGKPSQVCEQLAESLTYSLIQIRENFSFSHHRKLQGELNSIARALHERRSELGLSVFEVVGKLSKLRDAPDVALRLDRERCHIDTIDNAKLMQILAMCDRTSQYTDEFRTHGYSFWQDRLKKTVSSIGLAESLINQAKALLQSLSDLKTHSNDIAELLLQQKPRNLLQLEKLIDYSEQVAAPLWNKALPLHWAERDIAEIRQLLEKRHCLFDKYFQLTETAGSLMDVLNRIPQLQDVVDMISQVSTHENTLFKIWGPDWHSIPTVKYVKANGQLVFLIAEISKTLDSANELAEIQTRLNHSQYETNSEIEPAVFASIISDKFLDSLARYNEKLTSLACARNTIANYIDAAFSSDLLNGLTSSTTAAQNLMDSVLQLRLHTQTAYQSCGYNADFHRLQSFVEWANLAERVHSSVLRNWIDNKDVPFDVAIVDACTAHQNLSEAREKLATYLNLNILDLLPADEARDVLLILKTKSFLLNRKFHRSRALIETQAHTARQLSALEIESLLEKIVFTHVANQNCIEMQARLKSFGAVVDFNIDELNAFRRQIRTLSARAAKINTDWTAVKVTFAQFESVRSITCSLQLVKDSFDSASSEFRSYLRQSAKCNPLILLTELRATLEKIQTAVLAVIPLSVAAKELLPYSSDLQSLARFARCKFEIDSVTSLISENSHDLNCTNKDIFSIIDIETTFDWARPFMVQKSGLTVETICSLSAEQVGKIKSTVVKLKAAKVYLCKRLEQLHRVLLPAWNRNYEPTFDELEEWLNCVLELAPTASSHLHYLASVENLETMVDFPIVNQIREKTDNSLLLKPIFEKRLFSIWLANAQARLPALSIYNPSELDKVIATFETLDRETIARNSARVISERLIAKYPSEFAKQCEVGETAIIVNEIRKSRNKLAVRSLLERAPTVVKRLKPCFMMSPLAVSQLLPQKSVEEFLFDVLIFDEASQIFPEDAIPAISRCKQIIAVGDEQQLPPTSFFNRTSESLDEEESTDSFDDSLTATESILGALKIIAGRGIRESHLNMHYRSRDERLITFSNRNFYGNRLLTFPGPQLNNNENGISDFYLANATYDQGKTRINHLEAEKVCQLVFEHFEKYGHSRSIGVVALSRAQADYIHETIAEKRKNLPAFDSYFSEDVVEPFFVKNLENVQGDERDHIVLSIGFGPSEAGRKVMNNFGPIINPGGERRLNVAVSRARYSMSLVRSLSANDITSRKRGALLLKEFIQFCQTQNPYTAITKGEPDFDYHDLIADVQQQLEANGFKTKRFENPNTRPIDLAIFSADRTQLGLGIMIDGPSYFSTKTARDREWLRKSILKDLGWQIITIRARDWLANQHHELARVSSALELFEKTSASEISVFTTNEQLQSAEQVSHVELVRLCLGNNKPLFVEYRYVGGVRTHLPSNKITDEHICDMIIRLSDVEGPIHIDDVFERLRELFELGRMSSKFKDRALASIKTLQMRGRLTISRDRHSAPEFIWRGDAKSVFARRQEPERMRRIERIADVELQHGMLLVIEQLFSVQRDDLIREVAHQFGFVRLTSDVSQRLEQVLLKAIKAKTIVEKDAVLEMGLSV